MSSEDVPVTSGDAAVKWVWLDLDDTLWDFRGNSLTSLHDLYEMFGLSRFWPDVRTWIDEYHLTNDRLWKAYSMGDISRDFLRMERFREPLTARGYPDADARRLSSEMDPAYLGMLARMSGTVEGAIPLLERLRRHYRIGILSNGFKEVQYGKMRSSGIDRYVDCVVLSDETDANKPSPVIYDYACRKAGTDAAHCLLVGDNPDTDIAGAIRAGWRAIWFNPGRQPWPDNGVAPAYTEKRTLAEIDDGNGLIEGF